MTLSLIRLGVPEETYDAYALLGVCITSIARLEHTIDKVVICIDRAASKLVARLHEEATKSKKPPRDIDQKTTLICNYLIATSQSGRPALRSDFQNSVRDIYDQRIRLLHSELSQWRLDTSDLSTSFSFSKYDVEKLPSGKSRIVLQAFELTDATLEALVKISEEIIEDLRCCFPEMSLIDTEVDAMIKESYSKRGA